MKSIKEKQLLVNLAKALGHEADPALVKEIQAFNSIKENAIQSIKKDSYKSLSEAFRNTTVQENYPVPPTLEEAMSVIKEEVSNELVQTQTVEETPKETISDTPGPIAEQSLADRAAKFLSEAPKTSFQQPTPALPQLDLNALARKLQNLETWLGKISLEGPGSGEVKLRFLDDVDRNSIADDKYLRYESSTGKFTFDAGHKNNFHCAFQSNVNQHAASNVSSVVTYSQVDFTHGFRLESNSRIVTEYPGRYNLQFSIQLENLGAQIAPAYIWFRQNGLDVKNTSSKFDVLQKHAGANGACIAAVNYMYETVAPNEYVELAWWTNHWDDVWISTLPERFAVAGIQPNIPETPGVILTVTPVKVDSY